MFSDSTDSSNKKNGKEEQQSYKILCRSTTVLEILLKQFLQPSLVKLEEFFGDLQQQPQVIREYLQEFAQTIKEPESLVYSYISSYDTFVESVSPYDLTS